MHSGSHKPFLCRGKYCTKPPAGEISRQLCVSIAHYHMFLCWTAVSHRPWPSLTPQSPSAQTRSRRFCIICSSLQSSWTWRWTGPFSSGLQSTSLPASVTDRSDSDSRGKKRQTVRTKNVNKRTYGGWKTTLVVCIAISIHRFSMYWFAVKRITAGTHNRVLQSLNSIPPTDVMIYRLGCCHVVIMKYWRVCNHLI